jgi:hypothetical protein
VIRALTIRFGAMALGLVALYVFLMLVKAAPDLAGSLIILYVFGGGLLIARYSVAHSDEIPPRPPRDSHRT